MFSSYRNILEIPPNGPRGDNLLDRHKKGRRPVDHQPPGKICYSSKGMRGDAGEKNKGGLFHHLAKRFFVCSGISFAESDGLDRGIKD